ncbi:unnamed protein product, partial [Tilletia caries]
LERTTLVCTETTHGELLDIGFKTTADLLRLVEGAQVEDDGRHSLGDAVHLVGFGLDVGDLGTLGGRVERLEVDNSDTGTGLSRAVQGADNTGVNGIGVLRSGCVCREQDRL